MSVPIGTTPTFALTLTGDVDLTQAAHVYVDISGATHIKKQDIDLVIEQKKVSVFLSQEETLALHAGVIKLQVNWTYAGGARGGTAIGEYVMDDNLRKEVLP